MPPKLVPTTRHESQPTWSQPQGVGGQVGHGPRLGRRARAPHPPVVERQQVEAVGVGLEQKCGAVDSSVVPDPPRCNRRGPEPAPDRSTWRSTPLTVTVGMSRVSLRPAPRAPSAAAVAPPAAANEPAIRSAAARRPGSASAVSIAARRSAAFTWLNFTRTPAPARTT